LKPILLRRCLAEFIGTLFITFAPIMYTATSGLPGGGNGLVGGALAAGFTVMAMVYSLGPISASHLNPAVTIGFAMAKRFPKRYVPYYIAAQTLGGIAAAALGLMLFGAPSGATIPAAHLDGFRAFGVEAVLTFILMFTIMATATDKRVPAAIPPLAISMAVTADVLLGAPLTGSSMNPARSLGPALFTGSDALTTLPIYFIAPVLGAVLAAWIYEAGIRLDPDQAQSAPAEW